MTLFSHVSKFEIFLFSFFFYLDTAAKSLGRCKISLKRRSRGSTHSNSRQSEHQRRCRRTQREFCRVPALSRCPRSFHPHLDLQTFIRGFNLEFVCGPRVKSNARRVYFFFSMTINTHPLIRMVSYVAHMCTWNILFAQ